MSILKARRNPKIFGALWKNLVFPEWHENFEAFGISRYMYMSLKLRRLSTLRILFGQEVHRPTQVVKSEKLSGMIF